MSCRGEGLQILTAREQLSPKDLPQSMLWVDVGADANDPSVRPQTVFFLKLFGCSLEAAGVSGIIWETAGRRLEGIWEASERHLGGIWEASGRHLGGIWRACGRDLGDQVSQGAPRMI